MSFTTTKGSLAAVGSSYFAMLFTGSRVRSDLLFCKNVVDAPRLGLAWQDMNADETFRHTVVGIVQKKTLARGESEVSSTPMPMSVSSKVKSKSETLSEKPSPGRRGICGAAFATTIRSWSFEAYRIGVGLGQHWNKWE